LTNLYFSLICNWRNSYMGHLFPDYFMLKTRWSVFTYPVLAETYSRTLYLLKCVHVHRICWSVFTYSVLAEVCSRTLYLLKCVHVPCICWSVFTYIVHVEVCSHTLYLLKRAYAPCISLSAEWDRSCVLGPLDPWSGWAHELCWAASAPPAVSTGRSCQLKREKDISERPRASRGALGQFGHTHDTQWGASARRYLHLNCVISSECLSYCEYGYIKWLMECQM
jgi:hypothetical protein